jgi:hypothetical protein
MVDHLPTGDSVLRAYAARWVDTEIWPWFVEVCFATADGAVHSIIDKVPLFAFENEEPGRGTVLPAPVLLDCTILESLRSGDRMRVAIVHRSVSDSGYAEFTVHRDAVQKRREL